LEETLTAAAAMGQSRYKKRRLDRWKEHSGSTDQARGRRRRQHFYADRPDTSSVFKPQ
jgi:hypothetical protein